MRAACAAILIFVALVARAERIILIPLDNRPPAGQFAQMIARMASVEVTQPPYGLLGRFTQPGNPDGILDWLVNQDFRDVKAVVVSTDMIAYGSLIASRTDQVSQDVALGRLRRLWAIRKAHPKLPIYGFSAVMRLAPTATKSSAPWRMQLARYEEVKDRNRRTPSQTYANILKALEPKLPYGELDNYERARARNHKVQLGLIRMVKQGALDYLTFGQDDAQPYGPHIPETADLVREVEQLGIAAKVYFCEGIDQHANVLVSRALLRASGWVPRIRLVYSDDAGRNRIADYESKSISQSVRDQILASGARPALPKGDYDYTLYLNTPQRREATFSAFMESLASDCDQGFPVAVADIDLGKDGTADPELYKGLLENGRIYKLLAYAGWNTAGNTMGTSIPAANVYLLARRLQADPLKRELAQREFLLHRFVNDYSYHKYTRPAAYRMIDASAHASREETYGPDFEAVNAYVREDLSKRLITTFDQDFKGKHFFAGTQEYELDGLTNIRVFLPWPRAYEVRLEFSMTAHPTDHSP